MNNKLTANPETLLFHLTPSTTPLPKTLIIRNPSSTTKAFKIKITNRLRYIIKPLQGIIQPDSHKEISISIIFSENEIFSEKKNRDIMKICYFETKEEFSMRKINKYLDRNQFEDSLKVKLGYDVEERDDLEISKILGEENFSKIENFERFSNFGKFEKKKNFGISGNFESFLKNEKNLNFEKKKKFRF